MIKSICLNFRAKKNLILVIYSQACSTNPCTNGGTCWSSMNSFYCACRPGFTGKICEGNNSFIFPRRSHLYLSFQKDVS